jgi:hypothetical protein
MYVLALRVLAVANRLDENSRSAASAKRNVKCFRLLKKVEATDSDLSF